MNPKRMRQMRRFNKRIDAARLPLLEVAL